MMEQTQSFMLPPFCSHRKMIHTADRHRHGDRQKEEERAESQGSQSVVENRRLLEKPAHAHGLHL